MREITAFMVRDLDTGRVVFHEYFDSSAYSPAKLTNKIARRVARLERRYPYPRYEVLQESFDSVEAFYHFYPECARRDKKGE